jgi:sulfite exporter TauE/SafE
MIARIGGFRIEQFIATGLSDYLDFIIDGQIIDEGIKALNKFPLKSANGLIPCGMVFDQVLVYHGSLIK